MRSCARAFGRCTRGLSSAGVRSARRLLFAAALLVANLARGGAAVCPIAPGYRWLSGRGVPAEATTEAATAASVAALSTACSQRTDCLGFTTGGALIVSLPPNATWPEAPGAGACGGVYVRAGTQSAWSMDLTGLEVSHDFDLRVPYCPRVDYAGCKRLCERTPGCRSISFLASEFYCSLKSATCTEARLRGGCVQRAAASGNFMHADLQADYDFTAGIFRESLHYVSLTSSAQTFNDSGAICAQFDGRLATVYDAQTLNMLLARAQLAAASAPSAVASDGAVNFWLNGAYNASVGAYWLDGSPFALAQDLRLFVLEGCIALAIMANGTTTLAVRPCSELGFPMCKVIAPGTDSYGFRIQADGRAAILHNEQMSQPDAAAFCAQEPFRELFMPNGVRGRDMLAEITATMTSDAWLDGYAANPTSIDNFTFSDGSKVPAEYFAETGEVLGSCLSTLGRSQLSSWIYSLSCWSTRWVLCEVRERDPVPPTTAGSLSTLSLPVDWPARVRFNGGKAYLFFTSARTAFEATPICVDDHSGYLASVPNAAVDALIAQTWFDLDPPANNFLVDGSSRRILTYLGANNSRGIWRWYDGTNFTYQGNWLGGFGSYEACLILSSPSPSGPARWEAMPLSECTSRRRNFTCAVPPKKYLQPTHAVARGASLFELHLTTPRVFTDAREACRARGGDLASLSLDRDLELLRFFVYRLRHETGPTPFLSDVVEFWVGATTNKTDTNLTWRDFFWTDDTPFQYPMWHTAWPPGKPVQYIQRPGARTAATFNTLFGNPMLTRRRFNISRPFLCKTPVGEPLASAQTDDGTVYEVVSTPYAVPYHAAEQVCQARGGHLAGATSVLQLNLIGQMCSQALQALPRASNGGFVSHDVEDGCWVGLYCPSVYSVDVSFKDGFGESGLKGVAVSQPAVLHASNCSSASDLLWLDGRTAAAELASAMSAAGSTVSPSQRCGLVQRNSTDSNTTSLVMAPCKQFAAFVCERGAGQSPAVQPALGLQQVQHSTDQTPASSSTRPVEYQGCYAFIPSPLGNNDNSSSASSLALSPPPLPILLSQDADSMSLCKGLTLAEGATYFAIVDGHNCWVGKELPTAPFLAVDDDRPCRQQCAGDEASDSPPPSCSLPGYAAVHMTRASGNQTSSTALQGPTAYVCMAQQQLAAPNATLVGQLHVSVSELSSCEKVCTSLGRCDFYTYDTRAGACLLLGVPTVDNLASLSVYDALWAATTCVKAPRLVSGASPLRLAANGSAAVADHVCGPALLPMLREGPGVPALSPQHGQAVANLSLCAASCAANATCHGFTVEPSSSGAEFLCSTYTGILVDHAYDWDPAHPWLHLAAQGAVVASGTGCLPLVRIVPPPPYTCADGEDAAGWELRRFNTSSDSAPAEQQCRDACDADEDCSLYAFYTSPASCSLRFRAFYNGTAWPVTAGTNRRLNASAAGSVRSCLHTHRFLRPLASSAMGARNRRVRLGRDDSLHLCVPHMDARGIDAFGVDTYSDHVCAQACSLQADCSYFITTADSLDVGYCYGKKAVYTFTMGDSDEYPETGGMTRYDLANLLETCFNLERQLPRDLPSYVCAQQYAAAFVSRSRTTASTAAACEALCDAAADSCTAYTWMAHNSTCVLGGGRVPDGSAMTLAAAATGPSSLATHTCVHAPRFMSDGLSSPAAGQHMQANSVWSYCVTQVGSTAPPPDLVVKVVAALPATANASASFPAVRACAQLCFTTLGCQLYTLVWRSASDASPTCVLQGWSSATPLATPVTVSSGSSTANSGAQSLVCLPMSAKYLFAATSGILYPQVEPSAMQAYRTKQYTVHVLPAMYNIATLVCQNAGGLLATVNSQQELTVLANLLRPYLGWQVQPTAGVPLRPAAFWTGLQRGGPRSCSGYCSTYNRTTNASFVDTLTVLPGGNGSSLACGALVPQANATIGAALLPGDCASWELPFVCEIGMAPLAVGGSNTSAPVQLFPVRVGYDGAVSQATAAGAVVATLDLSAPPVQAGRRLLSSGRVLAADSTPTGARFTDLSAAMAACGTTQLRGSGCWVQLQPPASACSANASLAALCGAKALLLLSAASPTAANVRGLAGLAGSSGSGSCAVALQPESPDASVVYSLASCSTPAAFLAAVLDPDAALPVSPPPAPDISTQAPLSPPVPPPLQPSKSTSASPPASLPPSESASGSPPVSLPPVLLAEAAGSPPAGGSLSGGAIAGIVIGGVAGLMLILLVVALLVRRRKRQEGGVADKYHEPSVKATLAPEAQGPDLISNSTQLAPDKTAAPASGATTTTPYGSGSRTDDHSPAAGLTSGTTGLDTGSGRVVEAGSPVASRAAASNLLQQLFVMAEDPDQASVTWRIDPIKDISWNEKDELGKGTFGVVYRGLYKGIPVAVKTVLRGNQGDYDMSSLKSLLQEAQILAKIRHPNIVTCYGGCITDKDVFIVEELMTKSLGQLIAAGPLLPLETCLRIGMDIANGLFQLHPTVVHRDLKPDNVLLDAAGKAKISDFGLARFKMQSYLVSTKNFAAGTLPFMAPETHREKLRGISEKADIYSLAIILWTMLAGEAQPWAEYHYAAIVFKVSIQGERPELPTDPARCPPRLTSLMRRMWDQKPSARPGAADVLKQLALLLRDVTRDASGAGLATSSISSAPTSNESSNQSRTTDGLQAGTSGAAPGSLIGTGGPAAAGSGGSDDVSHEYSGAKAGA